MRGRDFLWALLVAVCAAAPARADIADIFSFSGYADLRLIAPANDTAWLRGGLGKFRFGPETGGAQAAEAYGQLTVKLDDDLRTVIVAGVIRISTSDTATSPPLVVHDAAGCPSSRPLLA